MEEREREFFCWCFFLVEVLGSVNGFLFLFRFGDCVSEENFVFGLYVVEN